MRDAASRPATLRELAWVFFRLGATAFGGPAAHIALMDTEIVRRRGWLRRDEFLDFLGAANLIPGPNSTEVAIHVGFSQQRWAGLLVAGTCFILPAAAIVSAIAWAYVRFGALPQVAGVLDAVKPIVIAVVAIALWQLGRSAVKSWWLAALAAAAVIAIALGVHELLVLAVAGALSAVNAGASHRTSAGAFVAAGAVFPSVAAVAVPSAPYSLSLLFFVFLKIGSVLFGSGYVLLAFLRADLVERYGWLTERQLLDAVAVGQVTPGPLFTTATFIGYILGGGPGAIAATVAIFLPAFVFVALSGPLVPRVRQSIVAGAVLDGVNAASLALMAVVAWQLGASTLNSPLPIAVCAATIVAVKHFNLNPTWPIVLAAAIGWATSR